MIFNNDWYINNRLFFIDIWICYITETNDIFAYDLDEYRSKVRGFYYDYVKFVPSPIAYTTEEIVELINRNEWDFEVIKEFAIRFNEYFDGKATERFIDEVLFKHKVNIKKAGETIWT